MPAIPSAPTLDYTVSSEGANIVLTLSEAVLAGSGTITISDGVTQTYMGRDGQFHTRLVGATDTRTISITDSRISVSAGTGEYIGRSIVTIDLEANLNPGLTYSVQMDAGALLDSDGMAYPGLSDTTQLSFTTSQAAAPDETTSATVISFVDTGSSTTDYITNETEQTFSGSLANALETGEFVQVSTDGGISWQLATVAGTQWQYRTTLTESGALSARVVNSAGVSSGTVSRPYVLDTAAPASLADATLILLDPGNNESGDADGITSDRTPDVRIHIDGDTVLEPGDTIEVYDTASATVMGSYTIESSDLDSYGGVNFESKQITLDNGAAGQLDDGDYSLGVRVKDVAGNIGAAGTPLQVTVDTAGQGGGGSDTEAPALSIAGMLSGLSGGYGDLLIAALALAGTVSDAIVEVKYEANDWQELTSGVLGALSANASSFEFRFSDTSGNVADNGIEGAYSVYIGDGDGNAISAESNSVIYGGSGDSTITMTGDSFGKIDGGAGSDTLLLADSDLTLDLADYANTLAGIEVIDLGAGNSLAIDDDSVAAVSGSTPRSLTIDGDSSDAVDLGGGGWFSTTESGGYKHFTNGANVTLHVDADIVIIGSVPAG